MIEGVDYEKMHRIQVALWAYAYEFEADSLVSDAKFDETCKLINPLIETNNPELDAFFLTEFHPDTGQWIHAYPKQYLPRLKEIYDNIKKKA